jgi:hypothetical protein
VAPLPVKRRLRARARRKLYADPVPHRVSGRRIDEQLGGEHVAVHAPMRGGHALLGAVDGPRAGARSHSAADRSTSRTIRSAASSILLGDD